METSIQNKDVLIAVLDRQERDDLPWRKIGVLISFMMTAFLQCILLLKPMALLIHAANT
ncbi:hypothetical protein [Neptunomonas antarctica]|uniref:Uncharacterized protein n=1 Tax=Neptunomonas antarctica TaxID=619304 RepID=A0A1N7J078_9GAMM|nr:hypothetical protein [Neptunomonas antarctica]SIS42763.1 hypothetical protein SAMN05421760_101417 [Neptunomonas antarctica]